MENITVNMNNLSKKEREQLLALITKANSKWEMPKNLNPGNVFKDVDGEKWIFLSKTETGNICILKKDALSEMSFGDSNNYNESNIDVYLTDTYLKELERKFGAENIAEHEVDLLSLDGEDDYRIILRKVSIPTLDVYRKNKKAIKNYINEGFWLATPSSTPSTCSSVYVQCICNTGHVACCRRDGCEAVRPMLYLKP